jgi:glycine betaine/proline transport system permease protein
LTDTFTRSAGRARGRDGDDWPGGRRLAVRGAGRGRNAVDRRARVLGAGVDTLAAITVAVAFSLAIGVPVGILIARNRRLRRLVAPILDVMQIMPTFAYLAPLVLLFGIGGAAATIVVLIYAMPAAIRITELGIRGVARRPSRRASRLVRRAGSCLRRSACPSRRRRSRLRSIR